MTADNVRRELWDAQASELGLEVEPSPDSGVRASLARVEIERAAEALTATRHAIQTSADVVRRTRLVLAKLRPR
jgi:hypothetical protein